MTWLRREETILDAWRIQYRKDDPRKIQLAFAENIAGDDQIDLVRQFARLVEKGLTPNAHMLARVAKGFRTYLNGEGTKTLDQSFELKPKQGSGHPLSRRLEKEKESHVYWAMWWLQKRSELSGKRMSVESAAMQVINRGVRFTEEKLIKNYRLGKYAETFDKEHEALTVTEGKSRGTSPKKKK